MDARKLADLIVAHRREGLASYKVPKEIEFRGKLPKSAALKILRRELQDEEVRKARAKLPGSPS